MEFDHLVVATPDLDQAKERFLEATGVRPSDGGSHPGRGTRNALVSFGERQYLEILAPDPEQSIPKALSHSFPAEGQQEIFHWALRSGDLPALAQRATESGLTPSPIFPASRAQPSGEVLQWDLMALVGHERAGLAPFFIDWKNSPHPADAAPVVGPLRAVSLRLPGFEALADFLEPAPKGVEIIQGEPEIRVQFDSPRGAVTWTAKAPVGFAF
ncbi:MAG: VOC family protein [Myxococcota bacterium]|nr:VOC family protein [Myxococcota bacterium]